MINISHIYDSLIVNGPTELLQNTIASLFLWKLSLCPVRLMTIAPIHAFSRCIHSLGTQLVCLYIKKKSAKMQRHFRQDILFGEYSLIVNQGIKTHKTTKCLEKSVGEPLQREKFLNFNTFQPYQVLTGFELLFGKSFQYSGTANPLGQTAKWNQQRCACVCQM